MRLLVACQKCRRQFDATGRKPGTRFRCHCGTVLTVEQPEGHDAAVVRCSSCGAPREERALNCQFCQADFTLRERDLHTVCPKCLARVSDRARFCHHCGVILAPESAAGDDTLYTCPACGVEHRMISRRIGEVTTLECDRCAGLWLGNEVFEQLTEQASSDALNIDVLFESARARSAKSDLTDRPDAPGEEGWQYRNCAVCGKMMHRRNYGRRSGVIIDLCRKHGAWFDADELPRILAWIRSGGLAKAKEDRAAEAARQERVKERVEALPEPIGMHARPMGLSGIPATRLTGSFVEEILEWLCRGRFF